MDGLCLMRIDVEWNICQDVSMTWSNIFQYIDMLVIYT